MRVIHQTVSNIANEELVCVAPRGIGGSGFLARDREFFTRTIANRRERQSLCGVAHTIDQIWHIILIWSHLNRRECAPALLDCLALMVYGVCRKHNQAIIECFEGGVFRSKADG